MVDHILIVKRSVSNVKCHWNTCIITVYAEKVVDLAAQKEYSKTLCRGFNALFKREIQSTQ